MNERLSWSEAEAVVRAYRAENGMSSDVDVATLARTLGTSPAEVHRLAGRKRQFTDRSGVVSALLAFGIVAITILAVGPSFLTKSPLVAFQPAQAVSYPEMVRSAKVVIIADKQGRVHALDESGNAGSTELWMVPTNGQAPSLPSNEKTL